MKRLPFLERFWSKVDKTPGFGPWGDCWLWTGTTTTEGYGQFSLGSRDDGSDLAHRLAFEFARGRPPAPGLFVCHRCDVRACVNDAHFFEGTQAENLEDMTAKGRRAIVRGEAHGLAKLDDRAVLAIRASTESQRTLATRYGVSQPCISEARTGRKWKHVEAASNG